MAFSLSLLRHRLAVRRATPAPLAPTLDPGQRPEGPLLWAQFCDGGPRPGVTLVIDALSRRFPELNILVTGDQEPWRPDLVLGSQPVDTRGGARAFLNHWAPDIAVFSGPDPWPITWEECHFRGIAQLAVDADPGRHAIALVRPLDHFVLVHAARDDPRLSDVVRPLGPLATTPVPPPVIASDLDDMTRLLASRPVWLSAATPPAEVDAVLAAHRAAAQLSHRLLLILELADPVAGLALADRLQNMGMRVALRSVGDEPAPDCQVLIADDPGEIGLWARLASITYMGGTLSGGGDCDPAIPAALGSVVIHGPMGGDYQRTLSALDQAQAAQIVLSSDALGQAVEQMLVPDRAAAFAHRAWDVLTRGAEASHTVLAALDRAVRALKEPA